MGKTADKGEARPPVESRHRRGAESIPAALPPAPAAGSPAGTVVLSADEAQRQREALATFFREKEEAWAKMTAAERDQAEREWQAFKQSMNESRAGGRVPYPD